MHLCFCKRCYGDTYDKKYCTLCSKVSTKSYDDKVLFKEILIDWEIIRLGLYQFFGIQIDG